jgi:predicted permease
VLAQVLAERYPTSNEGMTFRATSFRSIYSGDVRAYLLLLMGAVAFVLLIACANVANLQLSRAVSREQEIAVRVALGAGRRAIVGQMLMESAVPAIGAAVLGISLAYWCIDVLRALIGPRIPEWMQVHIDGRVLAFAALTTIVAAIGSGLAPALHAYRQSPGGSLKEGSRGASGGRTAAGLRNALVVIEVALAVVLVAGAGLLIRGFLELQSQPKGFTSDGLATFRVALGWGRYSGDAVARYYEQALGQLAAIPGVHGVGFIYSPPLAGLESSAPNTVQAEWQSVNEALRNPYVHSQSTSETYFELMDIPLRSGRLFSAFDRKDTQPVAIVSERLAQILWPGRSAIGQRLRYNPLLESNNPYRTVVGVVGNVHHRELGGEPSLELYIPFRQSTQANQFLIAKTSLPFAEFRSRAERAMLAIDPEQSMFDFQTYDDRIMAGIWQIRISRLILVLFGGVALLLSALGIYGVLSHLVGQRRRELGIRLALGATPGNLRLLVIRRALVLSGVGLGIGCVGAFVLGRVMAQMVRGLSGFDALGLAGPLVTLLAAALAASAVPAWRASRTNPVTTLRGET